ncbi:MAG: flagellar biosynthesis protein FlgN [Treponema sp.]|nr:flagellar biosynthesis protein FlgN [Treponema sp.]MBQ2553287.1 flagellar biosynthesis protein FlgN [Treponema sp.]MBQ4237317.1 flagellar biosynthesis protein FlgN [Treponema sp.]MBQ5383496.1 flagellar biosynthesis protein FlgN [Treponema sp.]
MNEVLSQEELAERVAVVKRFRALLEKQRDRFRQYLKVLELQENAIDSENPEAIAAHSMLEEEIVEGIGSLQKVIKPMQKLYMGIRSSASTYNPADIVPIEKLQSDLTNLQIQVTAQNERNRRLLKGHMGEIREQIVSIKNPYRSRQSVYADVDGGNIIQVEA